MKKIITMAIAALLSVTAFAQEKKDNVIRITTTDNESEIMMLNTVESISFEEVTPLTMDIEVSNITKNSMDIDFPMPEGCKYWLMCIQKEEIYGTYAEKRQEVPAHSKLRGRHHLLYLCTDVRPGRCGCWSCRDFSNNPA